MNLVLDGTVVRTICKAVACAGKIGNEILLEAVAQDSLCLRSINPAQSAFFNVKIRVDAFECFHVPERIVQVAVATKSFLAALRTPKVHNIRLTLEGSDKSKLCFQMESETTGLKKKYSIPTLEDIPFLNTVIDKSTFHTQFTTRPEVLSKLLSNFQAGASEMSVVCKKADGTKNLIFNSHANSFNAPRDMFLKTTMELNTDDEDIEYRFNNSEPLDLSFNLKDFKAMVQFCSDVSTDIAVYMDKPGSPVVVAPSFRRSHHRLGESDFVAEMLLASMEPANQSEEDTKPASAPSAQMNLSQQSAGSGAPAGSAAAPDTYGQRQPSTVNRNPGQPSVAGHQPSASGGQPSRSGGSWQSSDVPESNMGSAVHHASLHDEEMNGPTTMCYQQAIPPEFQHHRTYRTNRRSSVNRGDGMQGEVAQNVDRVGVPSQAPSVTLQQDNGAAEELASSENEQAQGWESDSEDGEDEECVLATPPDKRARY